MRSTKRILFIITSFVLGAVLMAGGAVFGMWFFEAQQGGTVKVVGSGVSLWQDAATTIPLTEIDLLDFGEIRADGVATISPIIYALNTGTDGVDITLSETGLPIYLTVSGNGEAIPTDPDGLLLLGEFVALDVLIDSGSALGINVEVDVIQISVSIDAVRVALGYDPLTPDAEIAGIIQILDELVIFGGMIDLGGLPHVTFLTWGAYGTTAVEHFIGEPTLIGLDLLPSFLSGEVMPIVLAMAAGSDVEFSDKAFTIIVSAEDSQ